MKEQKLHPTAYDADVQARSLTVIEVGPGRTGVASPDGLASE